MARNAQGGLAIELPLCGVLVKSHVPRSGPWPNCESAALSTIRIRLWPEQAEATLIVVAGGMRVASFYGRSEGQSMRRTGAAGILKNVSEALSIIPSPILTSAYPGQMGCRRGSFGFHLSL